MPAPVKLSELVQSLEAQFDLVRSYLDRQTGKVVEVASESSMIDVEEEDKELSELIEEDDTGRFVPLPDKFEVNEWDMMRDFAVSVDDPALSEQLERAIHGSGAFRYFKDLVHRAGIAKDWYDFRLEQYRQIALSWAESHEIEIDKDA